MRPIYCSSLAFSLAAIALASVGHTQEPNVEWYEMEVEVINEAVERGSALELIGQDTPEFLGFRTTGGDILCDRISVSFDNGSSHWLALNSTELFEENNIYAFELEDPNSPINRLNFTCYAVEGVEVTMHILGAD